MLHNVKIYKRNNRPFDAAQLLSAIDDIADGVLTDEHATASYGQPVLVVGGIAYGPGDVPSCWEIATTEDTDTARAARVAFDRLR